MVVIALPGPGNRGYDVEARYAGGLRHVRLMLPEEAPQHGREPEFKPAPDLPVNVVLVVPELVCELLALDREGDRNDHISESPAVTVASDAT